MTPTTREGAATPLPSRLRDIIDALGEVGRPAMAGVWREDSCIAATAIVLETLGAFGYGAVALPVETRCINRPLADWMRSRVGPPPRDGWEVDLGLVESAALPGKGGRTEGKELHLVAFLPDAGTLVDIALDQASRPAKGLDLGPTLFSANAERIGTFLRGEPIGWTTEEGALLMYRLRPPDVTWWRSSPNFGRRDAAKRARVVGAVVRWLAAKGTARN